MTVQTLYKGLEDLYFFNSPLLEVHVVPTFEGKCWKQQRNKAVQGTYGPYYKPRLTAQAGGRTQTALLTGEACESPHPLATAGLGKAGCSTREGCKQRAQPVVLRIPARGQCSVCGKA